jgi:D-alanyl-lipoteichoic acid acyltransferase DltB (MBOAT superfamily)
LLDVLLPVGISFYTFQTISYTIEVFRRRVPPERNPIRFALYVSFFPQLVAGPIERPGRLLPQIQAPRAVDADGLVSGLRLMLWGMFKKVVVADRVAIYVDVVYGDPSGHGGAQLMLATLFFAVQIYCDFSGYTDIAIGCARTLGFDLMKNFRRPYLAWCPTEFWRRWHISLSTWFRDYVYIPLGGSRNRPSRNALALMATFLISGFWHGANWTFVVWGALHGIMVLVERAARRVLGLGRSSAQVSLGVRLAGAAVTIPSVIVAWVFFRADSLSSAVYILTHLLSDLTLEGITCHLCRSHLLTSLVLVGVVVSYDILEEWRSRHGADSLWTVLPTPLRWCGYWSVAACTLLLGQLAAAKQFVYFQF